VEHHRRQHGKDRPQKIIVDLFDVFHRERLIATDHEPILLEQWLEVADKIIILIGKEIFYAAEQEFPERLFTEAAVVIPLFSVVDIIVQAPQPDRAELVQVGGGDAEEFQAVKDIPAGILRLIKN